MQPTITFTARINDENRAWLRRKPNGRFPSQKRRVRVIIKGYAGIGVAGHMVPKEVQLVVAKKTSRTAKSAVPESVTPVETASVEGARRPRAAAKSAAPKTDGAASGAKPRAPRTKRPASSTATVAVAPEFNGNAPATVETALVMVPSAITDEDIRVRAYFLSIEHRGQGSPDFFWHLAERQLRGTSR